jgi:hypothetical protein
MKCKNNKEAKLLANTSDRRIGKQKGIIVFSPVGDLKQLDDFCRYVKKMGINRGVDFAFVYREGLTYNEGCGLSAIHATEKYPLGTSGAFFAGQLMAYRLKYPIVVTTDLDAVLDSHRTFTEMAELCRHTGKVVSPANPENPGVYGANSMNHWTFFPRKVFDEVGFSIPFFIKGGEDYELLYRYREAGKLLVYQGSQCIEHSPSAFPYTVSPDDPHEFCDTGEHEPSKHTRMCEFITKTGRIAKERTTQCRKCIMYFKTRRSAK